MIVHVPADHRSVQVVSLPRDSWVNIPGHGMNKINAAFGIGGPEADGADGRAGHRADHQRLRRGELPRIRQGDRRARRGEHLPALRGGRPLQRPAPVRGRAPRATGSRRWSSPGTGTRLPLSDLARIQDQQQLLSSMLTRGDQLGHARGPGPAGGFLVPRPPPRSRSTSGFNVMSLADQLRGISPSHVTFTTVPIANASYTTPTGQSAVLWDGSAAAEALRRAEERPCR